MRGPTVDANVWVSAFDATDAHDPALARALRFSGSEYVQVQFLDHFEMLRIPGYEG